MAVCEKCGNELQQGAMICRNCGARIIPNDLGNVKGKKPSKEKKVKAKAEAGQPAREKAGAKKVIKEDARPMTPAEEILALSDNTAPEVHEPDVVAAMPADSEKVLSVGNYLGMYILSAIPLVNIICLLMWAIGKGNLNRKHWAVAVLIVQIMVIAIVSGGMALFLKMGSFKFF